MVSWSRQMNIFLEKWDSGKQSLLNTVSVQGWEVTKWSIICWMPNLRHPNLTCKSTEYLQLHWKSDGARLADIKFRVMLSVLKNTSPGHFKISGYFCP